MATNYPNKWRERLILSVYPNQMTKDTEPLTLNMILSIYVFYMKTIDVHIYVYSCLQGCVHSRNSVFSQCINFVTGMRMSGWFNPMTQQHVTSGKSKIYMHLLIVYLTCLLPIK